MGQNEELRASRALAEQEEEAERRRSIAQSSDNSANITNGHKSSITSINSSSPYGSSDSETPSHHAESPDQQHSRLTVRESSAQREPQRSTERKSPSSVHSLLN